jgi:tetratricopeptide (TPR) repeat protein
MTLPQSPSTVAGVSGAKSQRRPVAGRRRIVLRLIAVAFPVVVVVGVELGLRWQGWGANTTLVLPATRVSNATYYLNPRADFAYCGSELRGPEPRAFTLPKPKRTLRIVVVGASTVQGYPYPSELAFPRQMSLILSRQLDDRPVEVLNAGIVGLSTLPLVDVVRQAVAAEPDAIVMYEGHNEFYGVGGVATNSELTPLAMQLRRFRLIQVLSSALSGADSSSEELVTRLPRQIEIPAGSPLVTLAESRYRKHLTDMTDICGKARVPLMLCSVASNLRDQSPRLSDHAESPAPDVVQATPENAAMLREQVAREPDNALAHYRLAQCLEQLGERQAAADEYALARDFDLCRYRAPASFREVVRQVAEQHHDRGAHFVDLSSAFDAATEFAAPGRDLFLEHVHFTLDGHWLAARAISRTIVENVCQQTWSESLVPSTSERDEWLGVLTEDHLAAHGLAWFMLQTPPFDRAADAEAHRRALEQRLNELSSQLTTDELRLFQSINNKAKVDDLVDSLGRGHLAIRDFERALELFQLGATRRPWLPNSQVFASGCLHELHRDSEAAELLARSRNTTLPDTPPIARIRSQLERALGSTRVGNDF